MLRATLPNTSWTHIKKSLDDLIQKPVEKKPYHGSLLPPSHSSLSLWHSTYSASVERERQALAPDRTRRFPLHRTDHSNLRGKNLPIFPQEEGQSFLKKCRKNPSIWKGDP
ncbi:hypothetical protein JTB14_008447 [Gonioctena quinquepunctata]|nr:hypothetical protein JTB14_008447 [Gonioctena quinquepunctata]